MSPISSILRTRSDPAATPLVLDLTEDAVVLCRRRTEGSYEELRRAPLDHPNFQSRIDELRVEALVRNPNKSPITILLPESQILRRDYLLTSRTPIARREEAIRRLVAETHYEAGELCVDCSTPEDGAPTVVLAALHQTVREATSYCEKWGFVPGRVSTRHHAADFKGSAPVFALPKNSITRLGARSVQMAAAAIAALAFGYGALQVYEATTPILKALTITPLPAQQPLEFYLADAAPLAKRTSTPAVRTTSLQWIALTSAKRNDFNRVPALSDRIPNPAKSVMSPDSPFAPRVQEVFSIGPALGATHHSRPGRPANPVSGTASAGVSQVVTAIDRIRLGSRALSRAAGPGPTVAKTVSTDPPQSTEDVKVAALGPGEVTRVLSRRVRLRRERVVPQSAPQEKDDVEVAAVDPDAHRLPLPRPSEAKAPTSSSPVRDEESADVKAPPEKSSDPEEVHAAAASPLPRSRPKSLEERIVAIKPSVASKAVAAPKLPTTVKAAASERGLDLDETSLIGVMDARNGRRALVRLPGGEYLKVTNGDLLNGWRVSSISREAMKLTRQGRQRTLQLIVQ